MSDHEDTVSRLSAAFGIATRYRDVFGQEVETSPETLRALLRGFGFGADTEAEGRDSLERIERLRLALVPSVVLGETGADVRVPLRTAGAVENASWQVVAEDGAAREGRASVASGNGEMAFAIGPLDTGYYKLTVEAGGERAEATLIVSPARCWLLEELEGDGRIWGATAQVYGLRSDENFGIGDFSDIARTAEGAGRLGASFLGLSPLHALFPSDRTKISPYSPSSRLFLEVLHLDPRRIAGFSGSRAEALLEGDEALAALTRLRSSTLVDHRAIWELKRPVLEALWRDYAERDDQEEFRVFRASCGEALERHATFDALSEHFIAEGRWWLGDWPEEYRDPRSDAVEGFRSSHADRVNFYTWLQWQADLQLAEAAEAARKGGMTVGLYRDLAVGPDGGGSELWSDPAGFAHGLSIGAPPDLLGPEGQNWGLPPLNPLSLEACGLASFRALVRANMRHAGALRIDHAFQLRRLFLIPPGQTAREGAYVDYPFDAMLAVLRLESHRHRCLVIAEDLGTAPEGFSDAIMDSGILSYRLLPFERRDNGAFKRPQEYPRRSMAAGSTHDLPTLRGWWRALDVDIRETLGLADQHQADADRNARAGDRVKLAEALHEEGLLPSAEPPQEPPVEATVRYLARTPAMLTALQLEDVAGELNQANLPGVSEGHPNWRRRLGVTLEELLAPGGEFARLSAATALEGRGIAPSTSPLSAPPPRATYRLQFHEGFTLDDAAAIVPYLARLGVSHVYASPIHQARPGSTHGYDIVDHAAINSELGGEEAFLRLSARLKEYGLGLILDIVPNHMGVGGADNAAWLRTLEWGELAPEGRWFDVDWGRLGANGKIVVPFLGDRYGDALEKGDLKLSFDDEAGSFAVRHYEHVFPICPLHYPVILERAVAAVSADAYPEARGALLAVAERLRAMSAEADGGASLVEEADRLKRQLAEIAAEPGVRQAIDQAVEVINGTEGVPESFGVLHRILEEQPYRLAHWRIASSDINYRRFFDINSLAGVRVEEPEVFERTHETVFRLAAEGHIQGLRIDHIDGLADPAGYTRALQERLGTGFYVVIEKILEPGERLRNWPVAGTTGYDVLNVIDGLFVNKAAAGVFDRLYARMTGREGRYADLLRRTKREILETSFASELEVLTSDAKRIADADRRTRDYSANALRRALVEIVARFPTYRTYLDGNDISEDDRKLIDSTVNAAQRTTTLPDRSVHDFLRRVLLGESQAGNGSEARFRTRFQQLTGPVMAKSLEDTLFYRHVPLIALNEVGGDPGHFGLTVEEFHQANAERASSWPHAMIATATHDTKRGEDARARLLALSEMPRDWLRAVILARRIAEPFVTLLDGEAAPDANDQYLILQAVLGAWPMELLDGAPSPQAVADFRTRMEGFVEKALREAKRHTSWINPNEAYEAAARDFLGHLLDPDGSFLLDLQPLARRLAALGALTGLARTVLKCTLPGLPDIYQGTEFWDLSLVDPDNRRPVDYDAREAALDEADLGTLLRDWRTGRIKQALLVRLLAARKDQPELFAEGDYRPLETRGARAANVIGFERAHGKRRLVVAVPRLLAGMIESDILHVAPEAWGDTYVAMPQGRWRNLLTGENIAVEGQVEMHCGELFARCPVAVLMEIE